MRSEKWNSYYVLLTAVQSLHPPIRVATFDQTTVEQGYVSQRLREAHEYRTKQRTVDMGKSAAYRLMNGTEMVYCHLHAHCLQRPATVFRALRWMCMEALRRCNSTRNFGDRCCQNCTMVLARSAFEART